MREFFGVIFADSTEVILRVYQVEDGKWQLLHYASQDLTSKKPEKNVTAYDIAEVIADYFSNSYTQQVIEWKICARELPRETVVEIALAIGIKIECLDRFREQELLCKGMFTELW
jgi:hypothetical protein